MVGMGLWTGMALVCNSRFTGLGPTTARGRDYESLLILAMPLLVDGFVHHVVEESV